MDISKLLKQAQQMQADMKSVQDKLSEKLIEVEVGAGNVKVTATAAGDVIAISIDPSVIDPADADFLNDLVLSGVQTALAKAKTFAEEEMKKAAGPLGSLGGGLGF